MSFLTGLGYMAGGVAQGVQQGVDMQEKVNQLRADEELRANIAKIKGVTTRDVGGQDLSAHLVQQYGDSGMTPEAAQAYSDAIHAGTVKLSDLTSMRSTAAKASPANFGPDKSAWMPSATSPDQSVSGLISISPSQAKAPAQPSMESTPAAPAMDYSKYRTYKDDSGRILMTDQAPAALSSGERQRMMAQAYINTGDPRYVAQGQKMLSDSWDTDAKEVKGGMDRALQTGGVKGIVSYIADHNLLPVDNLKMVKEPDGTVTITGQDRVAGQPFARRFEAKDGMSPEAQIVQFAYGNISGEHLMQYDKDRRELELKSRQVGAAETTASAAMKTAGAHVMDTEAKVKTLYPAQAGHLAMTGRAALTSAGAAVTNANAHAALANLQVGREQNAQKTLVGLNAATNDLQAALDSKDPAKIAAARTNYNLASANYATALGKPTALKEPSGKTGAAVPVDVKQRTDGTGFVAFSKDGGHPLYNISATGQTLPLGMEPDQFNKMAAIAQHEGVALKAVQLDDGRITLGFLDGLGRPWETQGEAVQANKQLEQAAADAARARARSAPETRSGLISTSPTSRRSIFEGGAGMDYKTVNGGR